MKEFLDERKLDLQDYGKWLNSNWHLLISVATAIMAGLTLIIALNGWIKYNQHYNAELLVIKSTAENTHNDLQDARKTLENDMACIGTFFSLKDRANLRITNLQTCTIINDSTGQSKDLPLSIAGPVTTNAQVTPQNQTPKTVNGSRSSSGSPPQAKSTPQPISQPQGFLQRNAVKPIMNLINGVKGLL